jgi:rubrerythrin
MDPIDSVTWWRKTKGDPAAFIEWLHDQYRGETGAAGRIELLRDRYAPPGSRAFRVLTVVAAQERRHASWIGELLKARGEPPSPSGKPDRYWRRTLPSIRDLATGAAVGAHAEAMRLERIAAIAADEESAADVRAVFRRILPEEQFHHRAFASLSTPEAMAATEGAHELGRAALGLTP